MPCPRPGCIVTEVSEVCRDRGVAEVSEVCRDRGMAEGGGCVTTWPRCPRFAVT